MKTVAYILVLPSMSNKKLHCMKRTYILVSCCGLDAAKPSAARKLHPKLSNSYDPLSRRTSLTFVVNFLEGKKCGNSCSFGLLWSVHVRTIKSCTNKLYDKLPKYPNKAPIKFEAHHLRAMFQSH